MAALAGKVAKVKFTAAAATTSTGEAMTSMTVSTDRLLFRITDGTKRHWNLDTDPTVYVLTTAHTDFAINYVQGKVTFGSVLTTAEGDAVTVDARFHTASYLPGTRNWALSASNDMLDVTTFSTTTGDAQWRTFSPGLSGATVDLGRIVDTGSTATPLFFDRMVTDTPLVIDLVAQPSGGTTWHFEAYARVAGDGYATPIEALQAEDVSLQLTGPLFFASTE